jgi:hypothetical protein
MTGAANCTLADAVLQQILHHDLRDVVREFPPSESVNHPPFFAPPRLHVDATQYKSGAAILSTAGQVEELLNVSQNAETRFSVGPAVHPLLPLEINKRGVSNSVFQ